MNEAKSSHIPRLSVDRAVEQLSKIYITAIKTNTPFKHIPSVMLWGAPGVGKSQAIRQIASRIQEETGKKCVVTDVRLLLFNPIDLRGIPTANEDKTLAIWLKPQIFNMSESDKVINILFLDEISAAPQSVQAAAYQITLDRVIGEHKLPENCIVLAAGNRVTDKSVAFKMPRALANRLCHMEVESSFESWKRWAIASGVSPMVTGFLSFKHDYLIDDGTSDDLAFPTPRSWEMVSRMLNMTNQDIDLCYTMINGCVGSGVASEFRSWCKVYDKLPSIEDIFSGRCTTVPKGTDTLYALVFSMISYAKEHKSDIKAISNSIRYALNMPSDFSTVLMKNYMSIENDYKNVLMKIPEFAKWLSTKGRLVNGY